MRGWACLLLNAETAYSFPEGRNRVVGGRQSSAKQYRTTANGGKNSTVRCWPLTDVRRRLLSTQSGHSVLTLNGSAVRVRTCSRAPLPRDRPLRSAPCRCALPFPDAPAAARA